MRSISRHPRPETLADFAAARLDEARATVIATHLELCTECRRTVDAFEVVGGRCLEEIAPVALKPNALDLFWENAGEQMPAFTPKLVQPANDPDIAAARPLQAYLKGDLDDVPWKPVLPGISQHILDAKGYKQGVLRLLKISPGVKMARHSHREEELTLILRGAYRDEIGDFRAGDLADLDSETTHSPMAFGDEDCICLIATNAPLAFKDLAGKALQPFVGL